MNSNNPIGHRPNILHQRIPTERKEEEMPYYMRIMALGKEFLELVCGSGCEALIGEYPALFEINRKLLKKIMTEFSVVDTKSVLKFFGQNPELMKLDFAFLDIILKAFHDPKAKVLDAITSSNCQSFLRSLDCEFLECIRHCGCEAKFEEYPRLFLMIKKDLEEIIQLPLSEREKKLNEMGKNLEFVKSNSVSLDQRNISTDSNPEKNISKITPSSELKVTRTPHIKVNLKHTKTIMEWSRNDLPKDIDLPKIRKQISEKNPKLETLDPKFLYVILDALYDSKNGVLDAIMSANSKSFLWNLDTTLLACIRSSDCEWPFLIHSTLFIMDMNLLNKIMQKRNFTNPYSGKILEIFGQYPKLMQLDSKLLDTILFYSDPDSNLNSQNALETLRAIGQNFTIFELLVTSQLDSIPLASTIQKILCVMEIYDKIFKRLSDHFSINKPSCDHVKKILCVIINHTELFSSAKDPECLAEVLQCPDLDVLLDLDLETNLDDRYKAVSAPPSTTNVTVENINSEDLIAFNRVDEWADTLNPNTPLAFNPDEARDEVLGLLEQPRNNNDADETIFYYRHI